MHLKMYGPNPTHSCENPKCISSSVHQTPPMPARTQNMSQHVFTKVTTQNASQYVLTKPIPSNRALKIHPNPSHATSLAGEYSKCISTRDNQTNFNLIWPNSFYASADTKCISTWVARDYRKCTSSRDNQIHFLPASTLNSYILVLTKS